VRIFRIIVALVLFGLGGLLSGRERDEELKDSETATPTPTAPPFAGANLSDFYYPGADVLNSKVGSLVLQTDDDADKVTTWYKEKINSLGFNAKSFSKTTANGNVFNNLVAADSKKEVEVQIKRQAQSSHTEISVLVN